MTREILIDIIRDELLRQKQDGKVSIVSVDTPDAFTVIGVIDVHAIAEAILRDG